MKNYLTSRIKQAGSITVCVICPHCGYSERIKLKGLKVYHCPRCDQDSDKGNYYTQKELKKQITTMRKNIDLRQKSMVGNITRGVLPNNRATEIRRQRRTLKMLITAAAFYGMTTAQQQNKGSHRRLS